MKKNTVIICLMLCFSMSAIKSQNFSGKIIVGGSSALGLSGIGPNIMSIGYSKSSTKSDNGIHHEIETLVSGNFTPKIGIFVTHNLALGMDITLAKLKNESSISDFKYTESLISTGPFARYYMTRYKLRPYIEFTSSFGKNTSSIEDRSYQQDSNIRIIALGGSAGIAIPLGSKATFDIALGYITFTQKNKNNNSNNSRIITETVGMKFGFMILLGPNGESS